MKLLSAKNKKMAIMAAAILGALFLASTIYSATKAGVTGVGDILKYVWERIKSLVTFNSVVIALSVSVGLIGVANNDGVAMAVALGTLTTGAAVVTSFNTTYLPKIFHYTAATQLTGVKITVQGEGVVFDSDANGLNHAGVVRIMGQVTNKYTFRIANSFVKAKNIIWEFTNSAAQTPTVYVESDETAPQGEQMYLQFLRQAVLANSGQNFSDFATLSFPSIAAADVVNVLFRDGTQQQWNRDDILERLQWTQNVVNTPVYTIDNFGMGIKSVNIIAASAQTAYVQRWVPVNKGGMLNQVVNF